MEKKKHRTETHLLDTVRNLMVKNQIIRTAAAATAMTFIFHIHSSCYSNSVFNFQSECEHFQTFNLFWMGIFSASVEYIESRTPIIYYLEKD